MDLPAEPQLRWILRTAATLLEYGAEPVRGLVQPTREFFPDRFDGSPASVGALMERVQEHAGLADLEIELVVIAPDGQAQSMGCSSGACGAGAGLALDGKVPRIARLDGGGYRVALGAGEVRHPVALTTALVRAAAFLFLSEAEAWDALPPPDREPAIDLAAVLLGFGVLAANGSYIYAKGCGGVQVHSATRMPVDEVTVGLAIYTKLHRIPDRAVAQHLDVTPRACFDEAAVWASSNASLVRMLREAPDRVAADDYKVAPARSWLARALGIGKRRAPKLPEEELAEITRDLAARAAAKPVDEAKAQRLADIRTLVDEALEGSKPVEPSAQLDDA